MLLHLAKFTSHFDDVIEDLEMDWLSCIILVGPKYHKEGDRGKLEYRREDRVKTESRLE